MPPKFSVQIAQTAQEIQAAQRLRYDIFVRELGGGTPTTDHKNKLEHDAFDATAQHLILRDGTRIIGTYRLIHGPFYCADEYDLTSLERSGQTLLELGRSCLHPDYRGGVAMLHLWSGLADYIKAHRIDLLFGVASFHGTDPTKIAHALSLLHHKYRAPENMRVTARPPYATPMDLIPLDQIDQKQAMRDIPALIKAYLRLGGAVGDGAFIDHPFNTIDVCMIMPTDAINARQKAIYDRSQRLG